MAQRESKLSRNIQTRLRELGVFCFKVHGSEHMQAGLPDIIACVDGRFVGMETKMPAERTNLSRIQRHIQLQIQKAGGESYVVCSANEAEALIKQMRREAR